MSNWSHHNNPALNQCLLPMRFQVLYLLKFRHTASGYLKQIRQSNTATIIIGNRKLISTLFLSDLIYRKIHKRPPGRSTKNI